MSNVVGLFAKFAPGATARPVSPRSSIATLTPCGPGGRGDAVPACIPATFAPPAVPGAAADVGASAGPATPIAGPAQPLTHAQNKGEA